VLLNREGWNVSRYLAYRLYREEGLALRPRGRRRRRAAAQRRERIRSTAPNQIWGLDFVADQLADGRRFRALTVVDIHTRESLAIEAGQSLKGEGVAVVRNRITVQRGAPKVLFCDNGSEFTSQAMDLWAYRNGVRIDFSRPGKPTDNCVRGIFQRNLASGMPRRSPGPGRPVVDCGVKATSSERGLPTVKGKVGVELKALHAEHGLLEINAISDAGLKFGQRIELSVHYADGTINLHSVLWGVRGSQVEETFGIEH